MSAHRTSDAPLMKRQAARAVAMDRDLTHEALRVLKFLESMLGYQQPVGIPMEEIAEALGLSFREVTSAVRQLRLKGIIENISIVNGEKQFRFNPEYGKPQAPPAAAPAKKESMTPEQEMRAAGVPTFFDLPTTS